MANGRCRMHGGPSTGPRSPEGLERSRRARWIQGWYSAHATAERDAMRSWLGEAPTTPQGAQRLLDSLRE